MTKLPPQNSNSGLNDKSMDEQKENHYTLSVFTEDKIGLVNKITIVFTRRKINIVSLTTSESENKGVYRFTIVLKTTRDMIEKVTKQVEKLIGVLKAFFYEDDQVIYQELALYKVPTEALFGGTTIEHIIREHYARIITVEKEFIIIEKTGHERETVALFEKLQPYGVLGFVRSGRVALPKPMKKVMSYIEDIENNTHYL